jgi:hypothetical protein
LTKGTLQNRIKSLFAWIKFSKSGKRLKNIPSAPSNKHKNTGWQGRANFSGK